MNNLLLKFNATKTNSQNSWLPSEVLFAWSNLYTDNKCYPPTVTLLPTVTVGVFRKNVLV